MRELVRFAAADVVPPTDVVLRGMGLQEGSALSAAAQELLQSARGICAELAEPCGVFEEISAEDFAEVFPGEGKNAPATPLEKIFPQAEGLALFAATLGEPTSQRIAELFETNEFALAYMLDTVASEATDQTGRILGAHYLGRLRRTRRASNDSRVLPYSPGYCGWDVTGQGKLFARLEPAEAGVSLSQSFLMQPLKSVSGVLVAGPAGIHRIRADYPFCEACARRECVERMASIR
jgi:hypothetical protein